MSNNLQNIKLNLNDCQNINDTIDINKNNKIIKENSMCKQHINEHNKNNALKTKTTKQILFLDNNLLNNHLDIKQSEILNQLFIKENQFLSKYNNKYLQFIRNTIQNNVNKFHIYDINKNFAVKLNKKILSFSGGGIKGICFIGVLEYLYQCNILNNFEIFAGSSVSALIFLMILLEYTPQDLLYFTINFNFLELKELNIDSLFINYGLNNGTIIIKIIKQFLIKKNLSENLTFKNLYDMTNKLFIISGTNLTTKKCEYFSHLTTPDMRLIDAIRISTSLPFFFIPYKYNDNIYVDGSCTSELSSDCLYNQPFLNYVLKIIPYETIDDNILSVYLNDTNSEYNNLINYGINILNVVIQNKIDLDKIFLLIDTKNIKSYNFDLSNDIKIKLFKLGYNTIKDKINNY